MDEAIAQDTPRPGSTLAGEAAASPVLEAPLPTHGGSYLADPVTGALTLVERTKQPNEE